MKLCVYTLVLDGMPWLPSIYTTLNRLRNRLDWRWIVVQGVAKNTHCSSHCQLIDAGISWDGTDKWLQAISSDPRVTVISSSQYWDGKIEMVNTAVSQIKEPCVLIQMDSDEIWSPETVIKTCWEINSCCLPVGLNMSCEYFVGPGLRAVSPNQSGTDMTDWIRAWKYQPGQRFKSHCPPVLEGVAIGKSDLSFQHFAYVLENQVRFKQRYYGFSGMLDGWFKLQVHETFPVPLRQFWPYPWVDEGTMVYKL